MVVKPVNTPRRPPFIIPEDMVPLTCVVRRVIEACIDEYIPCLVRVWNAADVKAHCRRTCSLDLMVHAEM